MRRLVCCTALFGLLNGAIAQETPKDPVLIARPGVFKALVNPDCSHCVDEAKRRAGALRDDDRVLCWIRGYSDGGAIPYRFFLNPYRVISDTYGVFVYDPDAGFARGFEKSLDFDFHGWRNGVMVMRHKDGTLYSCLTGVAFDGPKRGTRLQAVPTLVSTWGDWLKRYPHNVAYHMFDKYQPLELPTKPTEDSVKTRAPLDPRLPAETMVLGVFDGKLASAYVLPQKPGSWTRREADRVILYYGPTKTAAAYRNIARPPAKKPGKPTTVTIEMHDATSGPIWKDKTTGSQWDIAGRAIAGELKGWTLDWLDATQVKWFAWATEYPQTTLHGK